MKNTCPAFLRSIHKQDNNKLANLLKIPVFVKKAISKGRQSDIDLYLIRREKFSPVVSPVEKNILEELGKEDWSFDKEKEDSLIILTKAGSNKNQKNIWAREVK